MTVEWKHCAIGDILELQRGYDITRSGQRDGAIPVVSSGGISSYHQEGMSTGPGVVIGRKGTLGKVFYLEGSYWPHDTTLWVRDFKGNLPKFVYYFFKTLDFGFLDVGSANPTLNRNHVHPLPIRWPDLGTQQAIVEVLCVLDDKIAANDLTLSTTTQLEDAIFRQGVNASAARPRLVSELASFLNRRRVPLSSRERSMRKGTVPYYGAAGRIDYVDEPLFTEPRIIVGEDGTVQTSDGRAVVQYVWGPSWVNNHAHVLVGRQVSTDFLRVALRTLPVADAVTGAAQPKLSMSRLSALSLLLPDELRIQELTARYLASAGVIRSATEESRRLAALRDALLPELMSGRLRVKDAEKSVEEVV